ncbi:MAG TPA: DUF4922 domain-containing protein [Smithellaceae bacterium]|nr:DUF4922 domain-containing protein [Smithellaceae bacterium]
MKDLICPLGRFLLQSVGERQKDRACSPEKVTIIRKPSAFFAEVTSDYLLASDISANIACDPLSRQRLLTVAGETKAGLLYSDYWMAAGNSLIPRLLTPYQPGSIRDDFHFGHSFLLSTAIIKNILKKYGSLPDDGFAAFYDLRLRITTDSAIIHLPEFLYTSSIKQTESNPEEKTEAHFNYVARENYLRQKRLEKVATDYLKRIGAHLPPRKAKAGIPNTTFATEASIIIPVLNRKKTIADALTSALSQKATFSYNIIVVDNHSTDGTGDILRKYAARHSCVHHLIPARRDLGIGGCWNEAIYSPFCGRYAVQLDSDDLYSTPQTLQKIVDTLHRGRYAMVVGAYTLVNEELKPIPPGLIDHREWTNSNGHNNLLRVNGLGAPRAFDTDVIRATAFPNVSYGEDYAIALRLSRHYKIGRIYESIYLCRRWADNTDAALSFEKQNRNNDYKDKLRTLEIAARQSINNTETSVKKPIPANQIGISHQYQCYNERTSELNPNPIQDSTFARKNEDGRKTDAVSLSSEPIFAEFPNGDHQTLPSLCRNLYKTQKKNWPALSSACRDLKKIQERELFCDGYQVVLQFNPGRALNSGAAVDQASIQKRPCFLCMKNRPFQQSGILYRKNYLILCNPAPIFPHHFTIAAQTHCPQEIPSSLDSLLQIAFDAAPDYAVFYNGPACGASAPDHLHFQLVPYHALPFLRFSQDRHSYQKISSSVCRLSDNSGRSMILMRSNKVDMLKDQFLRFLTSAGKVLHTSAEPPVNIICFYRKNNWQLMIFLRRKHRPDDYFAPGDKRIFVSPGAIDMAGVVITPLAMNYENLDSAAIGNIYREVSLKDETFHKIIKMLR